jgi:hypothetical protein
VDINNCIIGGQDGCGVSYLDQGYVSQCLECGGEFIPHKRFKL